MLSPVLGDEDLGRRDDLEAANSALAEALRRIDFLERQIALSTVLDLRYSVRAGAARSTVEVWCRDCPLDDRPDDDALVGSFAWDVPYGLVRGRIGSHEQERHGGTKVD